MVRVATVLPLGLVVDLAPSSGYLTALVIDGWEPYEAAIADHDAAPLDDEPEGAGMFYSSGTTGPCETTTTTPASSG